MTKIYVLGDNGTEVSMNQEEISEKYNKYVEAKIAKTRYFPSVLWSFLIGGLICLIAQGINDSLIAIFPTMAQSTAWAYTLAILIFIASLLTGLGVYDRIGRFAGGGTIVPITGFSNSITSPAIEYKHEGIIFGVCVKMFTIAGPVIVTGVVASVVVGFIYYIIGLF